MPGSANQRMELISRAGTALQHGDWAEAEKIIAPIRQTKEADPHVINVLALVAEKRGDIGQAIEWTVQLLQHAPQTPANLGVLVRLLLLDRRGETAERIIRQGLTAWPTDLGLSVQLSSTLTMLGRYAEAIETTGNLVAANPDRDDLKLRHATLLSTVGQPEQALAILDGLPKTLPGRDLTRANVLARLGRVEDAEADLDRFAGRVGELSIDSIVVTIRGYHSIGAYQRALRLALGGLALHAMNEELENLAFDSFQRLSADAAMVEISQARPDSVSSIFTHRCMVWVLRGQGKLVEAFDVAEQALAAHGPAPSILAIHALSAVSIGELHRAVDSLRQLERCGIEHSLPHASQIWFAYQFAQGIDWSEFTRMLERLDPCNLFDPALCYQSYSGTLAPDRRLRIGFIGSEFRHHAMAFTAWGFFSEVDHRRFEIIIYDNSPHQDAWTKFFQQAADLWRPVFDITNDQTLARMIHDDAIDILVDLPNHTDKNRLPIFQYRAAPIQVSWMHPTLVGWIDHILTDEAFIPNGYGDHLAPKRVWRIPSGALPYTPIAAADLAAPPCLAEGAGGAITFGNCNASHKLSRQAIDLYVRILAEIPNSRLVLCNGALKTEDGRKYQWQRFQEAGLTDASRLVLLAFGKPEDYIALYNRFDICLDSIPSGGGITSWDALLMGVPVVTLAGQGGTFNRNTASVLRAIRREEWIAWDSDDFVAIAARLASDHHGLAALRPALREAVLDAPINCGAFSREAYSVFRAMWWEWCGAQQADALAGQPEASAPTWRSTWHQESQRLAKEPLSVPSLAILQRLLAAIGRPGEAGAYADRGLALKQVLDRDVWWRRFTDLGVTPGVGWSEACHYWHRVRRETRANRVFVAKVGGEEAERRLRIGYFATDLYMHALGLSAMTLFRGADHHRFELFVYCDGLIEDEVTAFFRHESDHWRSFAKLTDEQIADQMATDRIDILVDLENHRRISRHAALCLRPAPLQASWLHPLAIEHVDHVIADEELVPPGWDEDLQPALVWRVACGSLPYNAPHRFTLGTTPPIVENGHPTIGIIGMPYKLTTSFMDTIARIMTELPECRLIIRNSITGEAYGDRLVAEPLLAAGIDLDRIRFLPREGARYYFDTYNRIDIFADAFPRSGGVTVWDALFMGVPVITLRGGGWTYSRNGASVLRSVGLGEWIVDSEDAYVALAIKLLGDRAVLMQAKRELRWRVQNAPIQVGRNYIQEIEGIYRRMWRNHCEASN